MNSSIYIIYVKDTVVYKSDYEISQKLSGLEAHSVIRDEVTKQ